MTYAKKIACALALAAGVIATQTDANVSVYAADQPGVAQSGFKMDYSLFDVPDGKEPQFYKDRLEALGGMLNEFSLSHPSQEEIEKVNSMIPGAYLVIFKNIYDDKDFSSDERNFYFQMYASMLSQKGGTDELVKLQNAEKAKDEPNQDRIALLDVLIVSAKIKAACEQKNDAALKAEVAELLDLAMKNDALAANAIDITEQLKEYDAKLAATTIKKLCAAFEAAPDQFRQRLAETLKGKERFANLVGNEMVVEGLYLDGKEIDWKSYRGKVVLVDFFATWCGPCVGEIPNVKAMYEKYNSKGFEVLSYSVDSDLNALEEFEKEQKLPWKTASETLSMKKQNDKGEPVYKNLSAYYGIDSIPRMILVGKDGKVIDTNARGAHLEELLEKTLGK